MKREDKLGPWFEDAHRHMRKYELYLRTDEFLLDAAIELEQAIQKYLKGALDKLGKFSRQDETHNIPHLIGKLREELLEDALAGFMELGERLYEIYSWRYPDRRPSELGLSTEILKQWAREIRRMKAIIVGAIEKRQKH